VGGAVGVQHVRLLLRPAPRLDGEKRLDQGRDRICPA
jgi:hypothetical protein